MIKDRVCFICVNISHVNNNFQTANWLCILHTEHDVYHAAKKRHFYFLYRGWFHDGCGEGLSCLSPTMTSTIAEFESQSKHSITSPSTLDLIWFSWSGTVLWNCGFSSWKGSYPMRAHGGEPRAGLMQDLSRNIWHFNRQLKPHHRTKNSNVIVCCVFISFNKCQIYTWWSSCCTTVKIDARGRQHLSRSVISSKWQEVPL